MTICIAAAGYHGNEPYVVCASDRKLTAGDIQFEPPTSKLWILGYGIVAMTAGDSAFQAEVCSRAGSPWARNVHESLDQYLFHLAERNSTRAYNKLLAPLGLNFDWLRNPSGSAEFIERRVMELRECRADIETIVCGVDAGGPHIFRVDAYGQSDCHSSIGFAAIGDGARHAASQFMFAKYTPKWSLPKTLLLVYSAKKRAEVAPGVGKETDLHLIMRQGGINPLPPTLSHSVTLAYEQYINDQTRAEADAYALFDAYVNQMLQGGMEDQRQSESPDSSPTGQQGNESTGPSSSPSASESSPGHSPSPS